MRYRSEVVNQAEHASGNRSDKHKQHLGRVLCHNQAGKHDGDENHHAAHGGRSLLDEVALGAIGANLLTDAFVLENLDPQGHEDNRDKSGDAQSQESLIRGVRCVA